LNEWKLITVKFSNYCIECEEWIMQGEQALWMDRLGIKHIECPTGIIEEDKTQLVIIEKDEPELLGIK